ncbi:hypothetical protein BZG75_14990 [Salinivibrio sp. AR640]|nr:hypothetical protein BZG75_14990 [Salinivibrio sp. AR640]
MNKKQPKVLIGGALALIKIFSTPPIQIVKFLIGCAGGNLKHYVLLNARENFLRKNKAEKTKKDP